MIQLLLIVCIIICLIVLFLKTKENFDSDLVLPSIDTLKATGGNKGIKLTWIKPHDSIKIYYILLFSNDLDGDNNFNVYLYNNTNTLLEYHIKNIPNNKTYNVGIMYKDGSNTPNISSLYMYNHNGNEDIITDKNSPLNFSDFEEEEEEPNDNLEEDQEESNVRCESKEENVNMELQKIINLLTENKNINNNYNINLL